MLKWEQQIFNYNVKHGLELKLDMTMGRGRILHSPSPYPILIYLSVTLLISNKDEKLNP